jgi:hypothetical protein
MTTTLLSPAPAAAAALTGSSASATPASGSLQAPVYGQVVPLARAGQPSVPVSLSLILSCSLPVDPRITTTIWHQYAGNSRSVLFWTVPLLGTLIGRTLSHVLDRASNQRNYFPA